MRLKIILSLLILSVICKAQNAVKYNLRHNLDRMVSLDIKEESVAGVMDKISRSGDFYFSYNGNLFKQDSLVSIKVQQTPVRDVLDKLFSGKVDYKENGEYIFLRYAANHFTIEPENITVAEKLYLISGYVIDTETGHKVKQASVYEKRLLQSTLTDDNGYFKLKFKGDHDEVILTASKEAYRDTTLIFLADIKIKPEGYKNTDEEGSGLFGDVEGSGIGRFFISSKQRIQNLNIPSFFTNSPFQASLTPGLSSHGIMSAQVVNKLSLNILGGYTAGTDGLEIAGLFNINKGDVKKLQFSGLFNQVGGSVNGFQVAGLLNDVKGETKGFHAAGLVNQMRANAQGIQVAGLGNLVYGKKFHGTQIAGIGNLAGRNARGIQIAGIGNVTAQHLKGVQIAGIFNYAKKMEGFQLGLINIADTSSGYSLGLINIIKNGYHKISLSTNEIVNTNLSIKTGNAKLYTVLFAGVNISKNEKVQTAGIGLGHDFVLTNRLSIGTELTGQLLYLGNWDAANLLNRLQANLQFQLVKGLTLFGGPAYAIYNGNTAGNSASGYKQTIVPSHHTSFGAGTKGWIGFNAGITIM